MKQRFFKKSQEKKQVSKLKFPNIYRIITDQRTWVVLVLIVLGIAIGMVSFELYKAFEQKSIIEARHTALEEDLKYWQEIQKKHPEYRDAYIKLAVISYSLGNSTQARQYISEALKLDPNSEEAQKLEKMVNKEFRY